MSSYFRTILQSKQRLLFRTTAASTLTIGSYVFYSTSSTTSLAANTVYTEKSSIKPIQYVYDKTLYYSILFLFVHIISSVDGLIHGILDFFFLISTK